jgi:O-antigen/teichoic acid export membrane protein
MRFTSLHQPLSVKPVGLAIQQGMSREVSPVNLAFLDQVMVSGVNFLTGILLAHFLGLEEFGRYTLIWMLVLLANMLQQSLVLAPMMSLGPKRRPSERLHYLGAVMTQQVVIGLVLAGMAMLLAWLGTQLFPAWKIAHLALPLGCLVLLVQAQEFVRRYLLSCQKFMEAFINDGISYLGQLACLWSLFNTGHAQTENVLWVIALTSGLAVIAGITQMDRPIWRWSHVKQVAVHHWQFARWLTAGSLMQWVGGQFFVIASAAVFSTQAAGAISAARNILGLTLIVFATMENVLSVQASIVFRNQGWQSLQRYLVKMSVYGGLGNGFICLVAALFAPFWMTLLFGKGAAPYVYLVYWFALTHFIMFFTRPLQTFLRTIEQTRPIAHASVLPMLFSLAASVPLVNTYGLTGSMMVMLGSQLSLFLYLLVAVLFTRQESQT